MTMKKGETAMDIRKKMATSIIQAIEIKNSINVNLLKANLALESGFREEFVGKIFELLEKSEIIFINDEGIARFTSQEMKKRGIEPNGQ